MNSVALDLTLRRVTACWRSRPVMSQKRSRSASLGSAEEAIFADRKGDRSDSVESSCGGLKRGGRAECRSARPGERERGYRRGWRPRRGVGSCRVQSRRGQRAGAAGRSDAPVEYSKLSRDQSFRRPCRIESGSLERKGSCKSTVTHGSLLALRIGGCMGFS